MLLIAVASCRCARGLGPSATCTTATTSPKSRARTDAVRQLLQATPSRASSELVVLLPALAATQRTGRAASSASVPWSLGFGLYQGDKLDAATQRVYQRVLVDALLPRLALRIEEQLHATAATTWSCSTRRSRPT